MLEIFVLEGQEKSLEGHSTCVRSRMIEWCLRAIVTASLSLLLE